MVWDRSAQRRVIALVDRGLEEKDIVAEVTRDFGCDDKSVRKCVGALQVRVLRRTNAPGRELESAEERFFGRLGGTAHYLRELDSAVTALHEARDAPVGREHRKLLLAALLNLKGVGPLPLRDTDLMMLVAAERSHWPIARGQLLKESSDGSWGVKFGVEGTHRWLYVEQHLRGNPFLSHLDHLKKAIAGDLAARLSLMSGIADRVGMPAPEGVELEVIDFDASVEEQRGVHPYFIFTLYDQLLSRALDLSHLAKRREEFRSETRGTDYLGGRPVVSSPDPARRATSIDYLVAAQEQPMELPEVELAANAHRAAEQAAKLIEWDLDGMEADADLFTGNYCDGCGLDP